MGIKTLWSILDCCGETVDLRDLRGQTLAIDLAGWVVQNSQCRAMNGKVAKPHLRNVFFRTSALISLGIKPIFVLDGAAPLLKRDTLAARRAEQAGSQDGGVEVKSLQRGRLKAVMGECRFLLSAMGLQCVQSEGEGEALCARMNSAGMVDAVVTEDSDVFCYGARTVLRNFSVAAKTAFSVERFSMQRIERDLRLSKDRLVLMAVMLGCDFFPSGVAGVGKETVMQLFAGWKNEWDCLNVAEFWIQTGFEQFSGSCSRCCCDFDDEEGSSHCARCKLWMGVVRVGDCLCMYLKGNEKLAKVENSIKKKCYNLGTEWWKSEYPKIVSEFNSSEPLPGLSGFQRLGCPKVSQCMSILVKKLAWTEEYAQERMIPLFSRWQTEHLASGGVLEVVEPVRIGKKRVVNTVPSVTIEWKVVGARHEEAKGLPELFESVEPVTLVEAAYPDLYATFMEASAKPKRQPAKPRAKKAAEKENMVPQKPITQFFSQRKHQAVVAAPKPNLVEPKIVMKHAATSLAKEADHMSSVVLSDSECSDLSLIIDDILSNKVRNMTVEMVDVSEPAFVTSTPAAKSTAAGSRLQRLEEASKKPPAFSVFRHNNITESNPEVADESEDSFDRMCK